MLPSYIKKDGDKVLYTGDGEVIYYIPEKFFSTKNAIINGEYVDVFGIFNYDIFDENGKSRGLSLFKYPTMITCKPTSFSKETMILKGTKIEMDYRLLHFKKDDELVCSTRVVKDVANAEKFTNLLFRANLPDNIRYDELHELLPFNASINGFSYNLINQMFGLLVSEICRDPSDLSKPFRLSKMKNMTDYKAIGLTKIPKYISPYTAITSENADEAVASAMTNKATGKSPLERVMMN